MRISRSFLKTEKNAKSEMRAKSHKLLYRGGFIRQISTGRYAVLPMGMRVQKKVIEIIKEEMATVGAQEMEIPILQPLEIWQITSRDDAFGDEMHVVDDHYDRKFVMSATGEALMTEIFGDFHPSYKDLPIHVYQFIAKFRDERRPRGGLIRAREFLMKDAYNFEINEEDFMKSYQEYWDAYDRIFERMGLKTEPVIADNGALGGDYSHEFMLITPDEIEPIDQYWEEEEELESMEIVDASEDEDLYNSILSVYHNSPEETIKNLVFKLDEEKFICVTIRGDYKVDFIKLRRLLDYDQIRPATKDEIEELGSYMGYVSAIGLDDGVEIIVDDTVKYNKNLWDGAHANKKFRKNVNYQRDLRKYDTVDVHEDKVFNAGGDKIVICDRCDYKANVEKAEFVREPVNMDQEEKEFKIIDQPEWVCTMDDNVEHYKLPKSHFLKNVVYKAKDGTLVIAVLRGDLDANVTKVENLSGKSGLELADDDDLASIETKSGWVHSWGHDEKFDNVMYVGDIALKVSKNLIGGQKEKTTDSFNVNYGRDFEVDKIGDIAEAYDGAKCKNCEKGYLREKKAMEMGHIFKYDTYYSEPHEAYFVDKDGKQKPMHMGAYGIGVGRAIAGIVEMHNDENGIIWPASVAPFDVHLIHIGDSKEVLDNAEEIYNQLQKKGLEVIWDDREDESVGVKFADADLIGVPIRLVVSEKTLKKGKVEIKKRSEERLEFIEIAKVPDEF